MPDVQAPHDNAPSSEDRGPKTGSTERHFDWATVTPAVAVIEMVASAMGEDPRDVEPLYDWIDPQALNRLFEPRGSDRSDANYRIEFRFADNVVTVDRNGKTSVRPARAPLE